MSVERVGERGFDISELRVDPQWGKTAPPTGKGGGRLLNICRYRMNTSLASPLFRFRHSAVMCPVAEKMTSPEIRLVMQLTEAVRKVSCCGLKYFNFIAWLLKNSWKVFFFKSETFSYLGKTNSLNKICQHDVNEEIPKLFNNTCFVDFLIQFIK